MIYLLFYLIIGIISSILIMIFDNVIKNWADFILFSLCWIVIDIILLVGFIINFKYGFKEFNSFLKGLKNENKKS
jgi:hypothetical protein